mmetsp:Transcript_26198/g.33864  ORF Transcript_26198/g.33864 Transcript_26198/m.33864 type:complete len:717 (-) Transcript_26198:247-2397(-)
MIHNMKMNSLPYFYCFCICFLLTSWFLEISGVLDLKKSEPATLTWNDVSCSIETTKGTKYILNDIHGEARPGRLVAILGPSGCGKTTLLNCLSGQLPYSKKQSFVGSILINGKNVPKNPAQRSQAYVTQEDLFYSGLTVGETLNMHAKLRLPNSFKELEKEVYVNGIMAKLGLNKIRDSLVGDEKIRGISGGEKKRLSLACELIGSPSLIFADEPTSGLDATQAFNVVKNLKALVKDGKTVIISIHQPRGSIFQLFDDIILLSEGELIYQGPARDAMRYFHNLGYNPPTNTNPAEWLLDLVSVDTSSPESERASRAKVKKLAGLFAQARPSNPHRRTQQGTLVKKNSKKLKRTLPGFTKQIKLLFARSWNQVMRSKAANIAKLMSNLSSGLIFGCIFYKLGYKQSNIMDRSGLLQVAVINTAMSSVMGTLTSFPRERTIVGRERSKSAYSIGAYFISKLLAELPVAALFPNIFGFILYKLTNLNKAPGRLLTFLGTLTLESFTSSALGLAVGALTPTQEAAMAVGPSLMTLFILFSGFYITSDNIPGALKWVEKISIIKWGFEALSVNEFKGVEFECDNTKGANIQTGEDVLDRLSFGKSSVQSAMIGQTRVLLGSYFITYAALKMKRPKFQPLKGKDSKTTSQLYPDGKTPNNLIQQEKEESKYKSLEDKLSPLQTTSSISSQQLASIQSRKMEVPYAMRQTFNKGVRGDLFPKV